MQVGQKWQQLDTSTSVQSIWLPVGGGNWLRLKQWGTENEVTLRALSLLSSFVPFLLQLAQSSQRNQTGPVYFSGQFPMHILIKYYTEYIMGIPIQSVRGS